MQRVFFTCKVMTGMYTGSVYNAESHSHPTPYLCFLSLRHLRSLPIAMIFSCLVLGQLWPTLGPLLLLVSLSGITSLLLFAHLFSLLLFPRLFRLNSYLFPGTDTLKKRFCSAYNLKSAIKISICNTNHYNTIVTFLDYKLTSSQLACNIVGHRPY